ncbi:nicastrin [Macadamia integrifolia]|uniref:nicastrin n=1 Tax=Macadamia integrifolia TaxID=60698 RepID=UPI001C4FFFF6|nr:nicastrin [Macadamia integrifolia]
MAVKLVYILLCFIAQLHLSLAGEEYYLESVPDLELSMYLNMDGYPCVRLLNLSGEIGCANPGREKVVAPIIRFKNETELADLSAVLVSIDDMQNFFARVSNDLNFAEKVGGVLVESGAEIQGFSPVENFPQAKFAPYTNLNYEWNPVGSGIMLKRYNFPVFLLSQDSTPVLQEMANKNQKNEKAYALNVAEFDLVMQTTRVGTHNSESCLKEQSCLPLGGYSVWSSLPPINNSSSKQPKPILLTVTSMDSASFFRDKSLGADSPLSGMIALLAAVDALSRIDGINGLSKQLVFMIFTGEAWGYLGSRRFLAELEMHTDAVNGLNNTSIELVLEIGSVGKGFSQEVNSFFTHTAGDSSMLNKTLNAFQLARDSLASKSITISTANSSNPGIPPSSLMALLRKNLSAAGIVLEDFDTAFINKFYHSHLDDLSNINSSAILAAASVVARTLYILASDDKELTASVVSSINVNSSLIEELLGCLLTCEPGLSCGLVKDYIVPTSTCPNHYVGVLLGEPSSMPHRESTGDISRFLWNFLADKTSTPRENTNSACSSDCSNEGEVCIKAETAGMGVCVISTTRYIPAYSTRLKFDSGMWKLLPLNSSDVMGMVDPVWTESFWNVIGLRVYAVQSATYDRLVLLAGIAVTVFAYIAIVATRAYITKALKQE